MTRRRDGTPQTYNTTGLRATTSCPSCGMVLRKVNLTRHALRRHTEGYVAPSRTLAGRARYRKPGIWVRRKLERDAGANGAGWVYVLHFYRAVSDHARHYCGWTLDVDARLADHRNGQGAALTREVAMLTASRLAMGQIAADSDEARDEGMRLAWSTPGSRKDERWVKNNRRLAELCPECRPAALAARAERARAWRSEDPYRKTQAYRRREAKPAA